MRTRTCLVLVWLLFVSVGHTAQGPAPSTEQIADGVLLYRLHDPELLSPAGPVAVQALRLDPRKVTVEIARAAGDPARERIDTIVAKRPGAVAAINAGFFSMQTGKPTDFLKVAGKVVRGTRRARGAVGAIDDGDVTTLIFDRLKVTTLEDGDVQYTPLLGSSPRDWARAQHAISGAGLLMREGRELREWSDERITAGFDTTRHPRTAIGSDAEGRIWLITVDGRNPAVSLGMSFTELQRLSKRLGLRSVLNLDGGGSTTMWAAGRIVNHPSDPTGPRPVGDAILVVPRER